MIEWLSQFSGLFVLVAFSAVFAGILLWVCLPKNKEAFSRYAQIPLNEVDE